MVDKSDVDMKLAKYIADTDYEDIPGNVTDVTKRSFLGWIRHNASCHWPG